MPPLYWCGSPIRAAAPQSHPQHIPGMTEIAASAPCKGEYALVAGQHRMQLNFSFEFNICYSLFGMGH